MSIELSPSTHEVLTNDWGVLFWRPPGWPGQWTLTPINLDGYTYSCAEQAMMHAKALLFNDHAVAARIMQVTSPREFKALGRQVRGFVEATWQSQCEEIVYRVSYAKFSQHPQYKAALLATGNKYIAECSPLDKLWGTGMDPQHSVSIPSLGAAKRAWRGRNLLGVVLMRTRETLRRES